VSKPSSRVVQSLKNSMLVSVRIWEDGSRVEVWKGAAKDLGGGAGNRWFLRLVRRVGKGVL
jgi:hypothetical protein